MINKEDSEYLKGLHLFYRSVGNPCEGVVKRLTDALQITDEEAVKMDKEYHSRSGYRI